MQVIYDPNNMGVGGERTLYYTSPSPGTPVDITDPTGTQTWSMSVDANKDLIFRDVTNGVTRMRMTDGPNGGEQIRITPDEILLNNSADEVDFSMKKYGGGDAFRYDNSADSIIIGAANLDLFGNVITGLATGPADNDQLVTLGYVNAHSDPNNLGWYATEAALNTAHPTASDGDYAIVGDTDTFWTWDTDTSAWVNTHVAPTSLWVRNGTDLSPATLNDSVLLENGAFYRGKTTSNDARNVIGINSSNDVVIGNWGGISGISFYDGGNETALKLTPTRTEFNLNHKDKDFVISKLTAGEAFIYDAGIDTFVIDSLIASDLTFAYGHGITLLQSDLTPISATVDSPCTG